MYKELIDSAEKATEELILSAEERIGVKFSNSFKEFCLNYDGAKLSDAEILAKNSNTGQSSNAIREFLGIKKMGTLEIEYWNDDHIAFAEDSFGNFFVFKKSRMDEVYFLDHETDQVDLVSNNFEEFLKNIIKADFSDLPDAKNSQVWIDPDFLKQQKDLGNA